MFSVEVSAKQLSVKVRSRIFSYLASQLSCSKGTLVKRAKKLQNLQQVCNLTNAQHQCIADSLL